MEKTLEKEAVGTVGVYVNSGAHYGKQESLWKFMASHYEKWVVIMEILNILQLEIFCDLVFLLLGSHLKKMNTSKEKIFNSAFLSQHYCQFYNSKKLAKNDG